MEPSVELDSIGRDIVDAAVAVHRAFGPGALESDYRMALRHAIERRGHAVEEEAWLDMCFEGRCFPRALRTDLVVDGRVVVALKAAESIHDARIRQLLTYLRAGKHPLGYLLDLGAPVMRMGIRRFALTR